MEIEGTIIMWNYKVICRLAQQYKDSISNIREMQAIEISFSGTDLQA